jgi:hypothetical protein
VIVHSQPLAPTPGRSCRPRFALICQLTKEDYEGGFSAAGDALRSHPRCSHSRQRRMEPYGAPWLQLVAIGCKCSGPKNAGNDQKTVAVGCDWLPREAHGKEGVDGSSPSEGSAKAPELGAFRSTEPHDLQRALGMEPFMEPSDSEARSIGAKVRRFAASPLVVRPWSQTNAAGTRPIVPKDSRRRRSASTSTPPATCGFAPPGAAPQVTGARYGTTAFGGVITLNTVG